MIDNLAAITEASSRNQAVEPAKKRVIYDQKNVRKKLGEYLIDSSLGGRIVGRKIIDNYLENVNLDQEYGGKEDSDQGKKRKKKIRMPWQKRESTIKVIDPEEPKKSRFFVIAKAYNERIKSIIKDTKRPVETISDLLLNNPLKMGIVYQILDQDKPGIMNSNRAVNVIQSVLQSEKFKSIYKTTLKTLGEVTLAKFSQAGFGVREADALRELLLDNPDFTERAILMGVAPTGNTTVEDWKNVFIDLLNTYPERFLEEYFGQYRLDQGDYSSNIIQTFKLGEKAVELNNEVKIRETTKHNEVVDFLKYHEKERVLSDRYWERRLSFEGNDEKLKEILFYQDPGGNVDRSTQSLVETGNATVKNNVLEYESEFMKIFGELNERNDGKKEGMMREDRFSLGVLYAMKDRLGIGYLPREEVLLRGKKILESARQLEKDFVATQIGKNFDQAQKAHAFLALRGDFGEDIQKQTQKIFGKNQVGNDDFEITEDKVGGEKRARLTIFRRTFLREIMSSSETDSLFYTIVNSKYIDGFSAGRIFGAELKTLSHEKYLEKVSDIQTIDSHIDQENAVINLLSTGEYIKNKETRSRVERAWKKTSRLSRFVDRTLTKARVNLVQRPLFCTEGDPPFMSKTTLKGKLKNLGKSFVGMEAFRVFVNQYLQDPVNLGSEAAVFAGLWLTFEEGGAVVSEIKARQRHHEHIPQKGTKLNEKLKKNLLPWSKHVLKEGGYFVESAWKNKKDISRAFWHNKGKYVLSTAAYYGTSFLVNLGLQQLGAGGPGGLDDPAIAPLILTSVNTAISGLLSGVGLRTGAESFINMWHRKAVINRGLEKVSGVDTSTAVNNTIPMPEKKLTAAQRHKLANKKGPRFSEKTKAWFAKKGATLLNNKFMKRMLGREEEPNQKLELLHDFLSIEKNKDRKFSPNEIRELSEFLNWMKEEESLLLIHNPRFYNKRRIVHQNGREEYIDNKKALNKIDETRTRILQYAEENFSRQDYQEVRDVLLAYDTDIKSIRKKLWKRRLQYTAASYGYRVTFMGLTYMFQHTIATQEMSKLVFGDTTRVPQTMIHTLQAPPTEVFTIESTDSATAANEVSARLFELSQLMILMNTDRLDGSQSVIDGALSYNGLSQFHMEYLASMLEKDGKNYDVSDLLRVVYGMSTYKEGQDQLVEIAKSLNGTDHKSLSPLVDYFMKNDPVAFMDEAAKDKHLSAIISLKYPDLAAKMDISEVDVAEKLSLMGVSEEVKKQIETFPIVHFTIGTGDKKTEYFSIDNVLLTFIEKLPEDKRVMTLGLLNQLEGIMTSDINVLNQAVSHHYPEFLTDSNSLVEQNLTPEIINDQPSDSVIYKIFTSIPESLRDDHFIQLIDQAKEGDAKSFEELYSFVEKNHLPQTNLDQIFLTKNDTSIYDSLFEKLPTEQSAAKIEILNRVKSDAISVLGLRPADSPEINLETMVKLNLDPTIYISPDKALSYALTHQVADLNMLVSLQGNMPLIFVQNNEVVGIWRSSLHSNANITEEDLRLLEFIEGEETDNSALVVPKLLRNWIKYKLGLGPLSGGSTPAVSLVEMMTGGYDQNPINPEMPSNLHNYKEYGVNYLMKLMIAQIRGRIPDELVVQMTPQTTLNQEVPEHKSLIDLLCFKFESFIAARQLVANYGEEAVQKAYLDNVFLGTINGVEIRGVDYASQVLFDQSYESLSEAQKFLIISIGQSPNKYLYEYDLFKGFSFDDEGHMIPAPVNSIERALYLLNGSIGEKIPEEERIKMIEELTLMKEQSEKNGWETVFKGGLELPQGAENFAESNQAAAMQGATIESLKKHIESGDVVSMQTTPDGILVVLKNTTVENVDKIVPTEVIFPEVLSQEDQSQLQLSMMYSGMFADDTLTGNFYKVNTENGKVEVPVWYAGKDIVVPGMATIEFGGEDNIALVDPTNTLSRGPQLFGSGFKPLVALFALKEHPEYYNENNLDQYHLRFAPGYFDGIYVENSANATDVAGPHDLKYVLAASGNVGMADLWTKMVKEDPNTWSKFQEFSHQFGIYFYEYQNGKFVPITNEPRADVAYGNIYVGGADPVKDSGLVQMAKFYHDLGVMGFKGEGDPKQVEAAKYILEALQNPEYKKEIPIWSPQSMKDLSPDCGDGSSCFFKTGTQSGVNKNGEWIAIRMGTYGAKFNPTTGEVTSVIVLAAGQDKEGNPVELGWASGEVLPIARKIVESVGNVSSPQLAAEILNETFANNIGVYKLGLISTEQLFPYLKKQAPDQYGYLSDSIRRGETKSFVIDLIGQSKDGFQTVALHLKNSKGEDSLVTFNIPANLIDSVNEYNISDSFDHSAQESIFKLMEQAALDEPGLYGPVLQELKAQGVNIIPVYEYETSPILFTLHEQMEKNGYITMGPEDAGAIMEKLGLDPAKTIFINGEMLRSHIGYPVVNKDFGALNDLNKIIVDQIVVERNYLQMEQIYQTALMSMTLEERNGFGTTLDQFLYDGRSSNQTYQLLKLFIDIKSNQQSLSIPEERQFLINNFERLINGPKGEQLAPDVVRAYNAFKILSDQLARGENPDPSLSKDLVLGLKRFPETTQSQILVSLGLQSSGTGGGANFTPLSINVPDATAVDYSSLSTDQAEAILNAFIAHPERFIMEPGEKVKVDEMLKTADVIIDAVNNNPESSPEELKNILINEIETKLGLEVDPGLEQLISQFSHGLIVDGERQRQCVNGFMVINRILHNKGLAGFPDMEGLGGDGAGDFIGPLREHTTGDQGEYLMPSYELSRLASTPNESLLYKYVNEINQIKVGDVLVIRTTWLDTSVKDSPGHIAQVLFSGFDKNNNPYLIVFDTNGDSKGTTQIRIITDLDQLVPQVAKDVQHFYPGAEPIFAIIRSVIP